MMRLLFLFAGTSYYAMICKRGGFIIQRHHYELRDLEAELLRTVCSDIVIERVLQDLAGEELNRGANTAPDARLDIRGIFKSPCHFPTRPYPTYLPF